MKAQLRKRRAGTARILIVDDHPLVRRGLAQLIDDEPDLEVCGCAEDVEEAMAQVAAESPDLVVVDISLKEGHGLELIKQIKACDDKIHVLVSSMHDENLYAELAALRAGAAGYVNKQEAPHTVIEAIFSVLRGNLYLSSGMTHPALHRLADLPGAATRLPVESLSDRELQVFELIGRGKTTRDIADHLQLSVKTIETYREKLKNKFDLKSAPELTCLAAQWVADKL